MPDPAAADGGLFLVTIPDPDKRLTFKGNVHDALVGEGGNMLVAAGLHRYILFRPAARALARRLADTGYRKVKQWLEGQDGVVRVLRVSEAEAKSLLANRDSDDPTYEPAGRPLAAAAEQWNLAMVRLPEAWQLFDDPAARPWRSVRVGHMDTGYTEHEVFRFDGDGMSPVLRVEDGADFVDGELPVDGFDYVGNVGHGTRTGGLLAGDPDGGAFLGVAPGVSVVPFRVTRKVIINAPFGDRQARLDLGIEAAVNARCQVISISLGDNALPPGRVGRAVDRAYENGVIIAAAAGNYYGPVAFPALYDRTIGVAGVTRGRHPWVGSSRGIGVDVSAPADEVLRPHPFLRDGELVLDSYGDGDGTSYATVHVSGTAALWLAHRGQDIDRAYGEPWQRVEAFRHIVRATATPIDSFIADQFGAGILDARAVLEADLPDADDLRYVSIEAEKQIF
jgi:subtilisin family serine protease